MGVETQPDFQQWLTDHAEALLARWQAALAAIWPSDQPALPLERLQELFPALINPAANPDLIAGMTSEGRGVGLPVLLTIPLQLHQAILDEQTSQSHHGDDTPQLSNPSALLQQMTHAVATAYSHQADEELEYLLQQQTQMVDESDKLALQLSTLFDLSQTLSASLERSMMLDALGPHLLKAFNIQHCALLLPINEDEWVLERGWGPKWSKLSGKKLAKKSLPKQIFKALETDSLDLVNHAKATDSNWLIAKQPVLYVPLSQHPAIVGCLVAQAPNLNQTLDANRRKLWQTAANQIVVALQNSRLFGEIQELNTDLEQKVAERTSELREERDRLEAIADIARDISTLEIDVLLNRILQALANLTGVQHGSVMLIDSGTGLLVDRAVLTEAEHHLGSRRFQVGEGIVGWIAQYRQPALVNDVQNDDRWVTIDAFGQLVGKNTGSLVGVPLIAGDDVVGVLMLSHPLAHYFNQSHLRLLKAIAGEIAIAIYNAQLYEYLGERTNRLYTMLRHQEEVSSQNNAILQSLNDAVIVFNTERGIILANDSASRVLDQPIDELVTQSFDELVTNLGLDIPGDPLTKVLSYHGGERPQPVTMNLHRGTQALQVALGPVLTERGELLGACLIARDITREVESDRLKTEFIGTVSHELRTPMTSIKGYTQLLAMGSLGDVNETQKEFLNTITSNAERMISIINDLLDITKIETGSVELLSTPLPVPEVLSEAISRIRADITQKGHDFSLNLAPNLPPLLADQERLHQVLGNLLSNAIKYTPRGGRIMLSASEITVEDIPEAQRENLNRSRQYIRISVQDSGVGIDPSEHEKIFDRFYRTENPLKIEAGGTGLGLALVRPLLNLMSGRIWVESEPEKGSKFTMILPVAAK